MARERVNWFKGGVHGFRVEQISARILVIAVAFAIGSSAHAQAEETAADTRQPVRASLKSSVQVRVDEVQREISDRLMDVAEFRFIREEAAKLGVRVWLFGGTAAGYAHYVKWDLLRKKGDARYQADRFDYDFTNIYRSTQDLDIVVDGSAKQIETLQQILAAKYPHFLGSNSKWELRSLRQSKGHPGQPGYKEALLGDFDFLNQNTDSNSTGMIEVTETAPRDVVRDLRDWDSTRPHFLVDVVEGKITFYHSKKHFETARAKAGNNPEIFSVMRALTKALQFDLAISKEDYAVMKEIVAKADLRNIASGNLSRRFSDIATKMIKNAVNMEEGMATLEDIGLREKLKKVGGLHTQDSVAWWANKEPLKSKPVGRGKGRTARDLGIDVVAHETNTFLAYESITRAHTGDPNVLISRNGVRGEAAAYGDGFYTQMGREGARGTGLTIRFKVRPDAREGHDFTKSGTFVIFQNKAAFRVIPESLNLSLLEYFEFLGAGNINHSDRAILEKFRRRLARMKRDVAPGEKKAIVNLVVKKMKEASAQRERLPAIVGEFYDLEFSNEHPEILTAMIRGGWVDEAVEMMRKPTWKRDEAQLRELLAAKDRVRALSKWASAFGGDPKKFYVADMIEAVLKDMPQSYDDLVRGLSRLPMSELKREWVEKLVLHPSADTEAHQHLLSRREFNHEVDLIEKILRNSQVNHHALVQYVLSKPVWRKRSAIVRLALATEARSTALEHILIHDDVPAWEELVRSSYHGLELEEGLLRIFSNPKSVVFAADFEKMIRGDRFKVDALTEVLALPHWTAHPELVRLVMMKQHGPHYLSMNVFSQPHWRAKRDLVESMASVDKSTSFVEHVLANDGDISKSAPIVRHAIAVRELDQLQELVNEVLTRPGWEKHPELIDALLNRIESPEAKFRYGVGEMKSAIALLFTKPHWSGQLEALKSFIRRSPETSALAEHVLGLPQWRRTDAPFVFAESATSFRYFVEKVLVHKDVKDRAAVIEKMLDRPQFARHELREIAARILPEPEWSSRPDIVARIAAHLDGDTYYGGKGEWTKVFKESRWANHPEIAIALVNNESAAGTYVTSVIASKTWRRNERVIEAAIARQPTAELLPMVLELPEPAKTRLYRSFTENAAVHTLLKVVESKSTLLDQAERLRLMDELLVRDADGTSYRNTAILSLSRSLSPLVPQDVALARRIIEQNVYLNQVVPQLFVDGAKEWRTMHSDLLRSSLLKLDDAESIAKVLKAKELSNPVAIMREIFRRGTRAHSMAVATALGEGPVYDRGLAEEIIYDPRANFETAYRLMMSPRTAGEVKWLEILARRGMRGHQLNPAWKIIDAAHWQKHAELKHLTGGSVTIESVHKLFARGFTFLTEEEYRRAGLSPAKLAFKRAVHERVFKRPRPATRCEGLFSAP